MVDNRRQVSLLALVKKNRSAWLEISRIDLIALQEGFIIVDGSMINFLREVLRWRVVSRPRCNLCGHYPENQQPPEEIHHVNDNNSQDLDSLLVTSCVQDFGSLMVILMFL